MHKTITSDFIDLLLTIILPYIHLTHNLFSIQNNELKSYLNNAIVSINILIVLTSKKERKFKMPQFVPIVQINCFHVYV